MRDEFKPDVKDILAKRVGMRYSNPNCRQPTCGPQEESSKVLNIGVAAHIQPLRRWGHVTMPSFRQTSVLRLTMAFGCVRTAESSLTMTRGVSRRICCANGNDCPRRRRA